MTEPCRPPPEYAYLPYHWVGKPGLGDARDRQPMFFSQGAWYIFGTPVVFRSAEAARMGWRYLGPCEPPVDGLADRGA